MWDFVVVTCYGNERETLLRHELSVLSAQNLLYSKHFLVVEAATKYGRGSNFLNALLLTIEAICRGKNITSVSGKVLKNMHILIIDEGNPCCYWPFGSLFLPTCSKRANGSGLQNYLEYLIQFCSKLRSDALPGVWTVFCDFFLNPISANFPESLASTYTSDVIIFTTDHVSKFSKYTGEVKRGADDGIADITLHHNLDDQSNIPKEYFAGIVYLDENVAQVLGSTLSEFPTSMCTYLGEDMGHGIRQISFYDVIGSMCQKEFEPLQDDNVRGMHFHDGIGGAALKDTLIISRKIRTTLWHKLCGFKASAFKLLDLEFTYLTMHEPVVEVFPESMLSAFMKIDCPHSALPVQSKLSAINSIMDTEVASDSLPVLNLIASQLICSRDIVQLQGNNSYIIGVDLCLDKVQSLVKYPNSCMINFHVELNQQLIQAYVVFSTEDSPEMDISSPKATIFGLNWNEYLKRKGIETNDIWYAVDQPKSLLTAKLFPIINNEEDWLDFQWIQDLNTGLERMQSWRTKQRFSISECMELIDHNATGLALRNVRAKSLFTAIEQLSASALPYLPRAHAEGWETAWLNYLDTQALTASPRDLPRFFIGISEVLASMAGSDGILRSGPAMHKDWLSALDLLEKNATTAAVRALKSERSKWMKSPDRLIRAARHYERAAQIMIKLAVDNVQKYMACPKDVCEIRPDIGMWIESECPVRLDLAGGWSDTPPICYEIGGVVVNIAIMIDGKRPIGARGRRINELKLVLGSSNLSQSLSISSVEQLDDITDPSTPGALIKAALLAAQVIDLSSGIDLPTQLKNVFGSGLELHLWSNVPQGSGLGTSSILAGALLAVIYTAKGAHFTRSQLVHAVLLMEQLMTTGGGWQDQVSGIFGGCNRGYSFSSSDVRVFADKIELSARIVEELNNRFILLFTGQARLARNLLQGVIRKWYTRDQTTVECFQQLVINAARCQNSLETGDMVALGEVLSYYWSQKKHIAPGCEPPDVKVFMDHMTPFVYGQSLAGAGGGGFYFALLKDPADKQRCENLANQCLEKGRWHAVTLDFEGLTLSCDGLLREVAP